MNLCKLLEDHAETRGDIAAIIDGERQLTFAELRDRARAMSSHLRTMGLAEGSKAVVFVPMSIDLYVVLLGLWHLGAVPVFVDPAMGRPQIEAAIGLAEPDLFIAIRKAHWFRLISKPIRKIPRHLVAGSRRLNRALDAADVTREPAVLASDAPGLLTFTSGTTGAPKGNLRSHGFLLAQHRALHEVLALSSADVDMPALPIFLLNTLASGTTAVIPPIGKRVADIDGAAFYQTLVDNQVTTVAGSPALFVPLAEHCRSEGLTLNNVRAFFLGGAPVPPRLIDELRGLIPNGDCCVVYGSTEAEPISHILGAEVLDQTASATEAGAGLCVGRPNPNISVRLVDEEILVSGPHVSIRYFNNSEAEAVQKVRDDDGVIWHRTGDAGRFDDQGRLWLLGRHSRIVERNGRRTYPFSVELAARSLTGITQAALLERDDRATLVLEGVEVTLPRELRDTVDDIVWLKSIPTDPRHNAKIDYAALEIALRRG